MASSRSAPPMGPMRGPTAPAASSIPRRGARACLGTLLMAAAVVGQRCSFELLARAAELGEHEALQALDEALRGSLLREVGGTYLLAHDQIREVAYAEASEARRRVFHRRALKALQRDGGSVAERTHHALAAGL